MALGGGNFTNYNKVLPGAYINFVNAARASSELSSRGIVALPLSLDWGLEHEVYSLDDKTLRTDSQKLFGYAYDAPELTPLREVFRSARQALVYRVNSGGVKASNALATAKYSGICGNKITIVITQNEEWVDSTNELYDVATYYNLTLVDKQTVSESAQLVENDYVSFKPDITLTVTVGAGLTGGENAAVANSDHQAALDAYESYNFNVLCCDSAAGAVQGLYAAYTRRMRDEAGVKFQLVVWSYAEDYEGIISVVNNDTPEMVYWVAGAQAGCAINASVTNKVYNGEYTVNVDYTQTQLEQEIAAGRFVLHRVNDSIRVLLDINTLTTYTENKGADFSNNQTVRVIDQIGNDIATLFNDKYLGRVQNDAAGRISLWADIVAHHGELQRIRAIDDYDSSKTQVEAGDTPKSVIIMDFIHPVNAMEQLYMTVVVE